MMRWGQRPILLLDIFVYVLEGKTKNKFEEKSKIKPNEYINDRIRKI